MDLEMIERYWDRRIANHRLTSGLLPRPEDDAELLLAFAGTFDGYAVRPDLGKFLPEVFWPTFERDGRLLVSG